MIFNLKDQKDNNIIKISQILINFGKLLINSLLMNKEKNMNVLENHLIILKILMMVN